MKNKLIFALIYLFFLFVPLWTVYSNTSFGSIPVNRLFVANLIQRILGLVTISLMFVQISLGFYMPKLTEKFGGWIYKFHIIHGILIYSIVIGHGISFAVFNYIIGKGFDPFYAFVDVCLYCKNNIEWLYNLGRIAFWLLTAGIVAGYFRTSDILRVHWRKFHLLNYAAFLTGSVHGFLIGTDFRTQPFWGLEIVMVLAVGYILLFKKLPELFKTIARDRGI